MSYMIHPFNGRHQAASDYRNTKEVDLKNVKLSTNLELSGEVCCRHYSKRDSGSWQAQK